MLWTTDAADDTSHGTVGVMSTVHRRPSRTAGRPPLPLEPISVNDAARTGWFGSAVRHAIATGSAVRPHRGTVVGVSELSTERWRAERNACLLTAHAGALTCDRAVLSHWPASLTYGLPTVGAPLRPCLTVAAGTALRELVNVHLHRATLSEDDVTVVDGRAVTSPARTVLDVAREHGIAAGVVAGDHALHAGLTDRAELTAALERCGRWPEAARARHTALFCDGRAESPLESLSRLLLTRGPLPPPELQVPVCDLDGRFVGRPDFLWDELGVVGEADGEGKYSTSPDAMRQQRVRERELQQTGLIVVRWGYSDLRDFGRVIERLTVAASRGARSDPAERRWGRLVN